MEQSQNIFSNKKQLKMTAQTQVIFMTAVLKRLGYDPQFCLLDDRSLRVTLMQNGKYIRSFDVLHPKHHPKDVECASTEAHRACLSICIDHLLKNTLTYQSYADAAEEVRNSDFFQNKKDQYKFIKLEDAERAEYIFQALKNNIPELIKEATERNRKAEKIANILCIGIGVTFNVTAAVWCAYGIIKLLYL